MILGGEYCYQYQYEGQVEVEGLYYMIVVGMGWSWWFVGRQGQVGVYIFRDCVVWVEYKGNVMGERGVVCGIILQVVIGVRCGCFVWVGFLGLVLLWW